MREERGQWIDALREAKAGQRVRTSSVYFHAIGLHLESY